MYKALIGNIRRAKDLGREEALKEVLEWLEDNFFTGEQEISQYSIEVESILKSMFSSKEQMLQSFKELFHMIQKTQKICYGH